MAREKFISCISGQAVLFSAEFLARFRDGKSLWSLWKRAGLWAQCEPRQ